MLQTGLSECAIPLGRDEGIDGPVVSEDDDAMDVDSGPAKKSKAPKDADDLAEYNLDDYDEEKAPESGMPLAS